MFDFVRYNTQLKSISGMSIDSQMAEVYIGILNLKVVHLYCNILECRWRELRCCLRRRRTRDPSGSRRTSDGDTTTSRSSWRCSGEHFWIILTMFLYLYLILDHLPAGENCCLSIIRRKKRQLRLKRRRKTRKQPPKFDVFLTSEIFIRFDKSKMSTV